MKVTLGADEIPSATYRLQFNRDFGFKAALEMVGYLYELGISDCYASPLFPAGPRSTHGYDVCGFDRLNPELGEPSDFDRFTARLDELGMGLLLDMVPNHMGADSSNAWWLDVLQRGQASRYADWFDIDWDPGEPGLRHQVLLPVLENHYARVLENGKLLLTLEEGIPAVQYHDRKFPLSPASIAKLKAPPRQHSDLLPHSSQVPGHAGEGSASRPIGCEPTATAARRNAAQPETHSWQIQRLNGQTGNPKSFDGLHALLQEQNYRLAYWKAASERINYRRFFDVTELVALRMEEPEVFQATHEVVLKLFREGKIRGLRIDHPDGLWDPAQYLERIQTRVRGDWLQNANDLRSPTGARQQDLPPNTNDPAARRLYLVVEKILTGREELPPKWPVSGTTGYDFLNWVNGVFVDGSTQEAFDRLYRRFTGSCSSFEAQVFEGKRKVLRTSFGSELNSLTRRLLRLAARSRYGQDLCSSQVRQALFEIVAAFPVYRTYITECSRTVPRAERKAIRKAIRQAKAARPDVDPAVFDFTAGLLLLEPRADAAEMGESLHRDFVMRFQQLTGPVMAKGVEDTAFYNFNRLISLNEVGGNPGMFGTDPADFHAHNSAKALQWPDSMVATATHDTKRGEDARARINVLSEMPAKWEAALNRWRRLNRTAKSTVDSLPTPHANDEYLFYQTLIGSWPQNQKSGSDWSGYRERLQAFILKAIREAKAHTSWIQPDAAYEAATAQFVQVALADPPINKFVRDFGRFHKKVAFFGKLNSLSQTLLKMTSPGVPDFYQGTELWDFSLVDPDNRRPVNYELRRKLLQDLRKRVGSSDTVPPGWLEGLLEDSDGGQLKLYLVWRLLRFRRDRRRLFARGRYIPLRASGDQARHVLAFARVFQEETLLVVVPRLVVGLLKGKTTLPLGKKVWDSTNLSVAGLGIGGSGANLFTGESLEWNTARGTIPLAILLNKFPVAAIRCEIRTARDRHGPNNGNAR
jgi:(1->4)-alpha-D-glucan 1-alpha-D-glucosylmutase